MRNIAYQRAANMRKTLLNILKAGGYGKTHGFRTLGSAYPGVVSLRMFELNLNCITVLEDQSPCCARRWCECARIAIFVLLLQ